MVKSIFEGIKIADFSWNAVGPLTIKYLANYGATVVHIESSTAPDASRTIPPYKGGVSGINRGYVWPDFNTDKYGMALNLNHPKGVEIARRLIAWADVVAESYTPGRMAKWGLGYDDAKGINSDIIYMSTCMEGQTGPFSRHMGFGNILVGLTGMVHLLGYEGGEPLQPYGAYTDWIVPRFAAGIVAAALLYRHRTGKGLYLDISQYEVAVQFLAPFLLDYSVNGRVAQRMGNRSPYAAPHGVYPCRGDNRWCTIAVFTEEEWNNLCQVMGNQEWTKDPRFSNLLSRKQTEEELDRLIAQWTRNLSPEEVMERLQAVGVPAGIVATNEDLFNDPQLKHRKSFRALEHSEIGKHTYTTPGFIMSKTPARLEMPGPCLGEHSDFVCTKLLGMSDKEFVELMSQGVFT